MIRDHVAALYMALLGHVRSDRPSFQRGGRGGVGCRAKGASLAAGPADAESGATLQTC